MSKKTAEESAVERAEMGVNEYSMTGAWRVIVARTFERHATYYFNENDHPRLKKALMAQAQRWYETQMTHVAN